MFTYQQARETVIRRLQAIRARLGPRLFRCARPCLASSLATFLAIAIILHFTVLFAMDTLFSEETHSDAQLKCIDELKAGDTPTTCVAPGTCIQIMTGAALPDGADAVIMLEHTSREGNAVHLDRAVRLGSMSSAAVANKRLARRYSQPVRESDLRKSPRQLKLERRSGRHTQAAHRDSFDR